MTTKIPQGHQAIMPYLMLRNARAFISFTKEVFNAENTMNTERDESLLMHAEIMINGATIMFADATEEWTPQTANMFVYVENADQTYAKALAAGATTVMEPADKDYGRTCGVTDPFGNVWWITSL